MEIIIPFLHFFDPKSKKFIVTYYKFQKEFPYERIDDAMATFKSAIDLYKLDFRERTDSSKMFIYENGKKIPFEPLQKKDEIIAAEERFTKDQYNFLEHTPPILLFDYISGIGGTDRDYPLMFVGGGESSCTITFLSKDIAGELMIKEVNNCFKLYKEYISRRIAENK